MSLFQQLLIVTVFLSSLIVLLVNWQSLHHKKNSFGLTPWLYPFGIFVWGDAVIISLFWLLVSMVSLWQNDWLLFWLALSLFWVVRSFGEMIYWLLEQFSGVHRNVAKNLFGFSLVRNESIFFMYQIFWQCCLVISLLLSIYIGHLWLASFN